MRVITVGAEKVRPEVRRARALNLELLGLAASSLILAVGVALAVAGKAGRLDEGSPQEGSVALYALKGTAEIEALLTMVESPRERQTVAEAIHRRAADPNKPLEHVGALAPDLSSAQLAAVKPYLTVRSSAEFRRRCTRALFGVLAAFWLTHLIRRWRRRDDDPVLLPVVMALCGIGMIAMIALRDPVRDTMAVETFAGGIIAGLAILLLVSEVDFEASKLRRAVLLPLGTALGLALALLLFGSGPGSSGVKVNLLGAQPVEAIRLLVVLALAAYFGRRFEQLRALSEPPTPSRPWLRYFRVPRWKDVRPVFASMALVLAFFFFQKDLGPALVLTCVFLALYGIGRGHGAFVLTGFALLLAGFAFAYWLGEPATVRQRVMIWSNPWNNGVAGGNQIAHGLWALATGATWGSGPGLGSPQHVPAGHTDFVLAVIGEEIGFVGVAAIVLLYAILGWRCLRIALRAPGDYSAFLVVGVALGLVVQALVIGSGLLGLVPLSGVVTPFLSFGRSSMLANSFAVGVVLAIGRRRGAPREHLRAPIRALGGVLAAAAIVVVSRAAWIQVVHADDFAAAASLSEQGDGGYRYEHNPRLLAAARTLTRGSIYDRNGLPLATSRPDEIGSLGTIYKAAGITAAQECGRTESRCYPLGGYAFHVIGDWNQQTNWGARNSSYVERDRDAQLKGYDDRARVVRVVNPRTGRSHPAIARDYRELLPLVRQRYWRTSAASAAIRARNREVQTSIDARLQMRVSAVLRHRIESGGHAQGAAVMLDAATGEVLAAVSYPWPAPADLTPTVAGTDDHGAQWLDRTRYGLYPPGSAFKLLVAAAALRANHGGRTFACIRLPDGRVGSYIRGSARPVRDDPMDTMPHGTLNLHDGLVVSCNAYFAQLAQDVGAAAVIDAASVFQMEVSKPQSPAGLEPTLAHAGYGQGQVVVSPLKMARLSASIASGGAAVPAQWFIGHPGPATPAPRFLPASQAAQLGRAMRDVVTEGTGRAVKGNAVAIAGKTGTAEVDGAAAHSWFTGFAPYGGGGRRIAFAVIVENAGYGARAAAPVAADMVTAARELGLMK
jgi:cell division protein FtsW (lipid II flippase)/cell division protein FtsI/penicillin-binding protein 2